MNEVERWIYFDGPEPEQVRPLLEALRDELPPATEEDHERAVQFFLAALAAEEAPPVESMPAPELRAPVVTRERAERLVREIAEPEVVIPSLVAPPPLSPAEIEAPASRAQVPLAGTGMALNLPREVWEARGRLPFRPPSPDEPKAPKVAKTMQVPVLRKNLGETAPLGDNAIERAATPFLRDTVGSGKVPIPTLTMKLYARLCVELTFWPQQVPAIFVRYKVMHEAARRALDAQWQALMAADPAARAAFDREAEEYARSLRAVWK